MSDSLSPLLPLSLSFVLHLALLLFFFLLDCCYVKLSRVQTGINTVSKQMHPPQSFQLDHCIGTEGILIAEDYGKDCRVTQQHFF